MQGLGLSESAEARAAQARLPTSGVDLYSDEILVDPFATFRVLRDLGSTVRLERFDAIFIGRFTDVRGALNDWRTFSSGKGIDLNPTINHAWDEALILFNNFTSQAVVPTGEKTSRYYFSWGPGSEFGGEDIAQLMIDVAKQAFLEDKVIIEAQQRIIDTDPSAPAEAGRSRQGHYDLPTDDEVAGSPGTHGRANAGLNGVSKCITIS